MEKIELATVTPREAEICDLVKDGFNHTEIKDELNISISTVQNHLVNIFQKLCVRNMQEVKSYVCKFGIPPVENRQGRHK